LLIGGSNDLLEMFILLFHYIKHHLELFSPLGTLGIIELLEVTRELLEDGLCSDVQVLRKVHLRWRNLENQRLQAFLGVIKLDDIFNGDLQATVFLE
jgi:hypothetical protein